MRVKLIIEYDGTGYAGWQTQKNALTVQETVEQAVLKATGCQVSLIGAGRTDAGVHAFGQAAHMDIDTTIPPDKLSYVINLLLPEDIRVRSSTEVSPEFHARKDAKRKHYRYAIYNAQHASAIYRNITAHVRQPLDVEQMMAAASYFKGTHDFSAFQAAGSNLVGTVRTIYSISVSRIGDMIYMDVVGNGFLYNMVRIMAGTLIDVGKGRLQPKDIEGILEGQKREEAGATAPAKGLTMMEVYYL